LDEIPYAQFTEKKQELLINRADSQVFIYTHSKLPGHSQNSGICLPDEVNLYGERLIDANLEMLADINIIINNDPGAIIIVAGDHGPYLTKNCTGTSDAYDVSEITRLDIQDRFGSFLSIRWPKSDYHVYDDITVLQDLFLAIFAYIYEDPAILNFNVPTEILHSDVISGASVKDGLIIGGIDDGEPLFLSCE
jgi:hypothetical protein